jgi:hypothetical protein
MAKAHLPPRAFSNQTKPLLLKLNASTRQKYHEVAT